jgi:hypothetical protein
MTRTVRMNSRDCQDCQGLLCNFIGLIVPESCDVKWESLQVSTKGDQTDPIPCMARLNIPLAKHDNDCHQRIHNREVRLKVSYSTVR